ncbi:hypothetical protein F5Y03DRAFT_404300 [Xylaria venustula]|nr:hypothetical protein F5Y03DRAFT_404300 [Xylaria venustula]
MATPETVFDSEASTIPARPNGLTLIDPGGFEELQARLEDVYEEYDTPTPEIDLNYSHAGYEMRLRSVWYFFSGAKLDDARDAIVSDDYWRWEFDTLFSHWMGCNPTSDQMMELASLWCASKGGGWRAIAVILRKRLLDEGMSHDEMRTMRLSCKDNEYLSIELNHLKPISERIEGEYWLRLAEQAEQESIYAMECRLGLVPPSPPAQPVPRTPSPLVQPVPRTPSPLVQPAPRTPSRQPRQTAEAIEPEELTQPAQRRKRQPRRQEQDVARPNVTTRAQARKQGGESGKERNFLRERTSNDRADNTASSTTTRSRITRGKATRGNKGGSVGAIQKKPEAKRGRPTTRARKQRAK